MLDRNAVGMGRVQDLTRVKTICPYCGVGCQMDLLVDKRRNRIVRVTSEPDAPINGGNLCVKGHFGFEFVGSKERLTQPLIRNGNGFEPATWDQAIKFVGERFRAIRDQHGPDAVAFISSARCTNEENYLVQKLARAAGRHQQRGQLRHELPRADRGRAGGVIRQWRDDQQRGRDQGLPGHVPDRG